MARTTCGRSNRRTAPAAGRTPPELATVGAGVDAVARDHSHPGMQQQTVEEAGQTTGCTQHQ